MISLTIQVEGEAKQPTGYSKFRKLTPHMKCMMKKKRAGTYGLHQEAKRNHARKHRDNLKMLREKSPQFDVLMKKQRSWRYKRQKAKSQAEKLEAEKQCQYFSAETSKMYEILKVKYNMSH